MKRLSVVWVILLVNTIVFNLHGEGVKHLEGELLVRLKHGVDVEQIVRNRRSLRRQPTALRCESCLSQQQGIYQFSFDAKVVNEYDMLEAMRNDPSVEVAQFNHQLKLRSVLPNDPRFNRQWQYINDGSNDGKVGADIDADLAWEVTTGGLTCQGDTIVVCIIDGGFQIDHPDLKENIWVNKAELPDNGIDDDANGYVDDYYGWNTASYDDDVENGDDPYHGTSVAGIIGAVGNNGLGVAGVNWTVKMMLVSGGTGLESEVIRAYAYALQARKRYNETGGEEGAFVVATSSSWGANEEFAADAPLWCAMYDELGKVGVLSAGATANDAYDVQERGDLPTTCESDYLIAVTNINRQDELDEMAAWGDTCIDMGAFGQGTYTTSMTDVYDAFGGTSAATPHVAGSIALLYSAPCSSFIDLVKTDPAAAALKMKSYLLDGGDDNATIADITLTGKRLNVNGSLKLMLNDCEDCLPPLRMLVDDITDVSASLTWDVVNADAVSDTLRWRALGDVAWHTVAEPAMPFVLTNLTGCRSYEVQMCAVCTDTVSDYSEPVLFRTDGCCENPFNVEVIADTEKSIMVRWNEVLIAEAYDVRWRKKGEDDWQTQQTVDTELSIAGLAPCEHYEVSIRTLCGDDSLNFIPFIDVVSKGCGACFDYDYCPPVELSPIEEWIAKVEVNTMLVESGAGTYGYQNFIQDTTTELSQGASYTLSVSPGFLDYVYEDLLKVWIDFNANGVFDSDEVVMADAAFDSTSTVIFNVPQDAVCGPTRMRVVMCSDEVESACSTWDIYGETEDYCVTIVAGAASLEDDSKRDVHFVVSPNPFTDRVQVYSKFVSETTVVELMDCRANLIYDFASQDFGADNILWIDLEDCPQGIYFLSLKANDNIMHSQVLVKY